MHLTKKQKHILDYLCSYIEENQMAPTYDEIAEFFGYRSKGTVHKHISNLEEKGLIRKGWNRARALEVSESYSLQHSSTTLPLRGTVAAGEPIEAIEDVEAIDAPADMAESGENYVLRVRGDSMIEENIQDGDYVIIHPREVATNGEMVIALIRDDEATLKKFYQEGDRVRLQPANPSMEPLVIPASDIRIRGVVIGVMRKYP